MKEQLGEIVIELLRNYKSRKFLLIVAYVAVLVLNRQQGWNMNELDLYLAGGAVGGFLLFEGIADIIDRNGDSKSQNN